jgi:hypothetical protein
MAKYSDEITRVISPTMKATTPFEAWNCLITDVTLHNTIQRTNQYFLIIQHNFSSESVAKLTEKIQIKGFTGLLCLAHGLRSNKRSLEELWGPEADGIETFRLVTSQRRFNFPFRCILE